MGMFDTAINTGVAAQQAVAPVEDNTAVSTINAITDTVNRVTPVAADVYQQHAVDADFEEIKKELDTINGALQGNLVSGQKRTQLQAKARARLMTYKANNPSKARKGDALYASYFGAPAGSAGSSGSRGSSFALTSGESAAKAADQEAQNYAANTGLSLEEGRKAVAAKAQAANLKNVREVGADQLAQFAAVGFNGARSESYQVLRQTLAAEGGTLTADSATAIKQDFGFKMQQQVSELIAKGVNLAPSEIANLETRMQTQIENFNAFVDDQSYRKLLDERNVTKKAENTNHILRNYSNVLIAKEAFGEQIVANYHSAILTANDKKLAVIKARSPELATLLDGNPSVAADAQLKFPAALGGDVQLTATESDIMAKTMASEPNVAKMALQMMDANNTLTKVAEVDPDAGLHVLNSIPAAPANEEQNIQNLFTGALRGVQSAFRDANGRFPTGVTITKKALDIPSYAAASGAGMEGYTITGEGIDSETRSRIHQMVQNIEKHRNKLPENQRQLPAEELAMIWINGTNDINNIPDEQLDPSRTVMTFDGPKQMTEPVNNVETPEGQANASMSQEQYRRQFIDQGIASGQTEEEAVALWDSLNTPAEPAEAETVVIGGKVYDKAEAIRLLSVDAS